MSHAIKFKQTPHIRPFSRRNPARNKVRASQRNKRIEEVVRFFGRVGKVLPDLGYGHHDDMVPGPGELRGRIQVDEKLFVVDDATWVQSLNATRCEKPPSDFSEARPHNERLAHLLAGLRGYLTREIFDRRCRFTSETLLPSNDLLQEPFRKKLWRAEGIATVHAHSSPMGHLLAERFRDKPIVQISTDSFLNTRSKDLIRDLGFARRENHFFHAIDWMERPEKKHLSLPQGDRVDWIFIEEDPFFQRERTRDFLMEAFDLWNIKGVFWLFRHVEKNISTLKERFLDSLRWRFGRVCLEEGKIAPSWLVPLSSSQIQVGPGYYSTLVAWN